MCFIFPACGFPLTHHTYDASTCRNAMCTPSATISTTLPPYTASSTLPGHHHYQGTTTIRSHHFHHQVTNHTVPPPSPRNLSP
ncbi:hypothetical protein Hamer_G010630 [Homarus americanus]|uniref:Uncharacterized protein n=1 Tax=Homarus americanus TaxID=6706 RepID=A0A8J5J971_HOMAM|nr:hypothetical protein Hamer_G010630 [Homarus americanus]